MSSFRNWVTKYAWAPPWGIPRTPGVFDDCFDPRMAAKHDLSVRWMQAQWPKRLWRLGLWLMANGLWTLLWLRRYERLPKFDKVAIPLVRRPYPGLSAEDIIGVQPMTAPVGDLFQLDYGRTEKGNGHADPESSAGVRHK